MGVVSSLGARPGSLEAWPHAVLGSRLVVVVLVVVRGGGVRLEQQKLHV